jgi:Holliday junction resolvasome RuvABC endonuclease subunit
MKYERFCETYPSEDINPYKWTSHAENHKSQIKAIIRYLNTHLKPILPDEVAIEDVANKKDFLKVRKNSTLPFNISGGTDIILVEEQCVMAKALKMGIYVTFELKKQ